MITEGQYLDSIKVVRDYLKQIKTETEIIENKTTATEFLIDKDATLRLRNVLTRGLFDRTSYENKSKSFYNSFYEIEDIESLTKREFLKIRNAGKKSWIEFVELRGY